ncbi:MAG TPA: GNAT family N-acetyltransferase [Candidatus Krumholzibacteria bacterium]|nr:GNAT family N-acetyltransferase [Candidatus Krumholzibacteria bacterium]
MIKIRELEPGDFEGVARLALKIYPSGPPWSDEQLMSHLREFAEGQLAAIDESTGELVGYAASLIIFWDDYDIQSNWRDFTDHGYFTNHDPVRGRTLYAADVMVDPDRQGEGIGKLLYAARHDLMSRLKLLRIRAGARLQGYHRYSATMSPEAYVRDVVAGKLSDATLSFQLKRGFKVIGVAAGYMRHDPKSLGYAAVIELINSEVATEEDYRHQRESPFFVDSR